MSAELRILRQVRALLVVIAICAVLGVVGMFYPEFQDEMRVGFVVVAVALPIVALIGAAIWYMVRAARRQEQQQRTSAMPMAPVQQES